MDEILKKLIVVYVEDEEPVLRKIGNVLNRRVKEIYLAKNGLEGLKLVREHKPHMVITDLEMPVMNGIEMIERIRKDDGNYVPIIVLTAYRDEDHYTDLANAYVYKPIMLPELLEKMTRTAQESDLDW